MAELAPDPERCAGFSGQNGIPLELRRMPNPGQPPVLLLHGASAQHRTFCIPRGRSLANYLWQEGYEPWLLDWRGSRRVTDALERSGKLEDERDVLDLDHAAREDLPEALTYIALLRDAEDGEGHEQKIHVVAHCLGAGVLAQAIASEAVTAARLGRVVLLTLGLFYESPLDGKVKSQFQVLDRLWRQGAVTVIDPNKPDKKDKWPPELREIYEGIGTGWRPHPRGDGDPRCSHAVCNRVSFMYGVPYRHSNLVKEIHGTAHVRFAGGSHEPRRGERVSTDEGSADDSAKKPSVGFVSKVARSSGSWRGKDAAGTLELSGSVGEFPANCNLRADDQAIATCGGKEPRADEPAELGEQFGAIPLRMYLQGAQNVRRGWAGPFVDTKRDVDMVAKAKRDGVLIGTDARGNFLKLSAITLITGARNQLWHRDSVNRMYEWLTSGSSQARAKVRRHVLREYAHQDLLWGKRAKEEVFPLIVKDGLGGPGTRIPFTPNTPQPSPSSEHSE